MGFRVEGAKELRTRIKQAEDQGLTAELKQAYRDAANIVVAGAQRRAPHRSGALRDSIRPMGGITAAVVAAGNAKVQYAAPIHWGWPKRGIKAQPFIQQALKDDWDRIQSTFEQAINRVSEQVEG